MQPTHNQQDSDATDINTATAPLARCQQPPSYEAATRHPPAYAAATRQPPRPSQQHHEDLHQPDTVPTLLEQCQESAGSDPHEPPTYREQRFPASTALAGVTLSPATASAQNSIVSQPAAAAATSGAGSSSVTANTPSAAQHDYLSNWRTSTVRPGASADDAGVVGRHRIASFSWDHHYRSHDLVSIVYLCVAVAAGQECNRTIRQSAFSFNILAHVLGRDGVGGGVVTS